jgi:inosose dehydratase
MKMRLGYQTNTWGGVVGHPVGVTSIKDLYYLANGSTEDALADVAAAGYEGVELFDGNLMQYAEAPERLVQLLEAHGLKLIAVYSGANFIFPDVLSQELWRIEGAALLAASCGATHLVVGGGAQTLKRPGDREYKGLGAALEEVCAIAERNGLTASFHPHLTTIVETAADVARVLDASSIHLCPDTGHVLLAGDDPATLIKTHAERIEYIHLKDVDLQTRNFVPLGTGSLDLPSVMRAIDEINFDGWVTVELDEWPDPLAGATTSRQALTEWLPSRVESHGPLG